MFSFLSCRKIQNKWYFTLKDHLSGQIQNNIESNCPGNYKLAYWHFDPQHLEKKDGKYIILKCDEYVDRDGKHWKTPNHPPPD
jgi:hypothetical protein